MASRFWVGGTGIWDTTSTANWSATNGGASGASAPVSGDTVSFTSSSGGGVVTASGIGSVQLGGISCTAGNTTTLTGSVTCAGSVSLISGGTYTGLDLTITGNSTLTTASKTISSLSATGNAASNAAISISAALTVTNALTLGNASNKTVTLTLPAGATVSVGSMATAQGTDGLHTLNSSSSGSRATLSDTSDTNTLAYLTVKDIAFTGGATWTGGTSAMDGGNNTGITGLASGNTVDSLFFGVVA